jgi:osmotically-inducible protein OsmY
MKTDAKIQQDVMDELKWEPFLNATEIGVAVKDGIVTLSGTVDSYSKKIEAEKAAKRVTGVKAVAEEIEVKLFASSIKNDTEIAKSIADSLRWHSAVQEDKIKVKVEGGWVTFEGEVDWEFQRLAAENAIKNLTGVKGISNLLTVKPSVIAKDAKRKITSAFQRSATIDADKISIEVLGSKVTLKGKVRSWAEKNDAENAVWATQGVIKVDNKLEVESESEIFAL